MAITYLVLSLIFLYLLSFIKNVGILFALIEIPTLLACYYVIIPNKNISYRLPINWVGTAIIAYLFFLTSSYTGYSKSITLGNLLGVIAWCFLIYWFISSFRWSIDALEKNKESYKKFEFLKLFSIIITIWGATLQISFILIPAFITNFNSVTYNASIANSFIKTFYIIENVSLLRFLPIIIFLLGILLLTSFKFQDHPFKPKSMDEVLKINRNSLLYSFSLAIRLPIWLIILIIGFVIHFSKLFIGTIVKFFSFYSARFLFITIGLIFAPIILYISHSIVLYTINYLSYYFYSNIYSTWYSIKLFFMINLYFIVSLSLYVISIPPLSLRYRGEQIFYFKEFIGSIKYQLITLGKPASTAVGQTFSLYGIIIFLIPVIALLPGSPDFGVFCTLYSIIVLLGIIWYYFKKRSY